MKKYMVIEHFNEGALNEIYTRFHEKGRMLPEGLYYKESWLAEDGLRCFQLMETDNFALFKIWEKAWMDLARFEIIELRETPAANST